MVHAALFFMDTQALLTETTGADRRVCWQYLQLEDLSYPDNHGPTSICRPESVCVSHGVDQEGTQDGHQEMLDLGVSETALEFITDAGAAIYPLQEYEGVGRDAEALFSSF